MAEVGAVYSPEIWAMESLLTLEKNLLMARLVHTDFSADVARYGDTINTRKPTKGTVKTWAGQAGTPGLADDEIEVQRPTATNLAVVLDKFEYTSFMVEDMPRVTSIKSLQEEFLIPYVAPLAENIDTTVITEFITGTDWNGQTIARVNTGAAAADAGDVIALMKKLDDQLCPQQGRNLVASSSHNADFLGDGLFVQADQSGSTEALINARLGRKFNFDVFMSQNIPVDATTTSKDQSLAFHRNALAYVTRPLEAPEAGLGAVSVAVAHQGYALRYTRSYDHRAKGTVVSFDILYGVGLMDAALACKLVG